MSIPNLLKTTLTALLLTVFLPILAAFSVKHVAIAQFVEHVAADAVRQGLLEELAKRGYVEGKTLQITFENAQGNAATAGQIARKFIGLNPDLIVAITTPAAQAIVKATGTQSTPIVFTAVTDPVGAGLVSSLTDHKSKVTGIYDAPPLKEQISLIKEMLPTAKTLGVLYNPGDSGSVSSLEKIKAEAATQGLALLYGTPVKSSDIQAAVLQLIGKVDALYVPLDNMLVSAMQTVSSLALKHKLPLFSADGASVKVGALANLGYSYHQVGLETGKRVADILEGADPRTLPVTSPHTKEIVVNPEVAQILNITPPSSAQQPK